MPQHTDLVASLALPVVQALPPAMKIDNVMQSIVLAWYLYNYTPLDNMEIGTTLLINSGVHFLFHDLSCRTQEE